MNDDTNVVKEFFDDHPDLLRELLDPRARHRKLSARLQVYVDCRRKAEAARDKLASGQTASKEEAEYCEWLIKDDYIDWMKFQEAATIEELNLLAQQIGWRPS